MNVCMWVFYGRWKKLEIQSHKMQVLKFLEFWRLRTRKKTQSFCTQKLWFKNIYTFCHAQKENEKPLKTQTLRHIDQTSMSRSHSFYCSFWWTNGDENKTMLPSTRTASWLDVRFLDRRELIFGVPVGHTWCSNTSLILMALFLEKRRLTQTWLPQSIHLGTCCFIPETKCPKTPLWRQRPDRNQFLKVRPFEESRCDPLWRSPHLIFT